MLRSSAPGSSGEQFSGLRGGMLGQGGFPPIGVTDVFRTRFFRTFLAVGTFALLFPFVLLSSSSEAEDIAPWRSALELDRLWGGVLGCADAGNDEEAVTNALAGDTAPGGVQRDYLDCGTRALRAEASRMLVDTIEDSLRWGGLYAFDQEFRLESNLAWEFGGDFRGELDTILPIGGELHSDGTGRALFLQQGITFWEDRNKELRSDSNTGLVYRGHVSRDWILGGSFFFDYNFQREHSRLSVGVDAQSENFYGGLNYYFTPSGREWRRGRPGYEERVLEGWDLRWSFTWEQLRLSGAFGTWIFDGEGPGRRQSVSVSAGYMVYPGLFLEAGYEYHDDRSVDEDWNVGLAFRYSLPEMGGVGGGVGGGMVPDLWRIVDRERRILYEERLARPRVSATLAATPNRVEEGDSVTVRVVLGEALEEDVFFSVAAASSSTVEADDYDPLPSRMMIPAGAMSTEDTFGTVDDGNSEPAENLDLELNVLQESFFSVSRGNPHHARVVIGASDNTIVGFATESTSVTEGVDVDIPLALGEPAPASGLVLTTSSDKVEDITTDEEVRISPGVQNGQYIRVTANNDNIAEPAEMVQITLSEPEGGLPEGWRIGRSTHMLMIQPNGLNIAFSPSSSEVNEDVGTVNLVLVLNESAPAGLVLNVSSNLVEDAVPVSSTLAVAEGARRVELPVRVIDDELGEGDEVATIRISDAGAGSIPEGWSIGQQSTHALTIKDNDLFVGFERSSSQVRESDLTTNLRIVLSEIGAPTGGMSLSVSATGNDDNDISFTSPVLISAGEKGKTLSVTIAQDNLPEDAERIVLTLSGQLPGSWEYGQTTHELTILPNGNEVAFERSSTPVNEGVGTVNLALELSRPAPEGLVLAFDSSSPDDAVPAGSTLRVSAGATSATLSVRIIDDGIGELGETVTISILGGSPTVLPEGWSIGSQDTHDLIVTDDDLVVGFESSSSQVRESELTTELPIVLSAVGAPTGGLSLSVSATGNEGNDISFSSLLPISGGDKMKTLAVALTQDGFTEDDERIVLTLSGSLPDPWKFSQRTHELTILSNEQTAMFAEAGKTVNENVGTTSFKVVLSKGAPAGGVPLQVAITSGNDDGDVAFTTQNFTIAEGLRERTINVTINDDNLAEPDEVVTFTLAKRGGFPDEWGGLGSQTTFELTITDDDSATVGFTTTESVLTEGDTTATLTVTMSAAVSQKVEVTLTESGDGNNDLAFTPTLLPFEPGETSKEVTLTVNAANDDSGVEEDVEITYTLGGTFPGNVSLASGRDKHVVTFVDDDSATIGFTTTTSTLTESDTTATLTVLMSAEATQQVEVTLTESGDSNSDLSFAPASLTFLPGETRKEVMLTVNAANADNIVEEDVEITYTLGGAFSGDVSLAAGRDKHVVTFADDDSATIGFTTTTSTLLEGDTMGATLAVRLNGSVSQRVVVALSESGDGNNDIDFSPIMLVFDPGETEEEVRLTVNSANDDALPEGDVEITYTLADAGTSPDSVRFDPRDHVVTFADDDRTISFKDSSSSAHEGTTGHPVAVVLNFDPPADGLVVAAAAADGDHKNDVSIPSPMLSFTGSARELFVSVDVLEDNHREGAEIVQLELAEAATPLPAGWTLVASGDDDHDLTIHPNDHVAMFAEAGKTVNEGDGTIMFKVTLSDDAPAGGVPLQVAITSGNENNDVTFTTQNFTIAEGNREHPISVDINPDDQSESEEVVRFTLSKDASGAFPDTWGDLGSQTTFDLTITDDDATVGFQSDSSSLVENAGDTRGEVSEDIVVKLNAPAPADGLNIVVSTDEGSGADNVDLNVTTGAGGVLAVPAGGREVLLPVMAVDDSIIEEDELVVLTLSKGANWPEGWEIGGGSGFFATHTVTILANGKTIGFAGTLPAELEEGTSGFPLDVVWNADISNQLYLGVVLEKDDDGDQDYDVRVDAGRSFFNEYEDSSQVYLTYTGPAGSDQTLKINVRNDVHIEEDENVVVRLVPRQGYPLPEGWSINPAEYRFTIPTSDKFVGFESSVGSNLVEDAGDSRGKVSENIVLKLNTPAPVGGLNLVVSVNEETDDEGDNTDVNVTTGTGGVLAVPAGDREVLLPVMAVDDNIPEGDEPVLLTLSKGANWPEGWEIGGGSGFSAIHAVTILGNDKKVGWQQAIRKLVSEANFASVSPVVTNYPAPAGGLHFTVEVIPHGGSYAPADVSTDPDSGDLFYREEVSVRENTRFQGVNTVAPRDDGEAEPDEAAVFRLSVKNGEQLPPGWEWSNQDLEVVIFANDNDFTFTDQNGETEGSYSEGDTVRLTAVMDNPLPPPVSDDQSATFDRRVGRFGMEITEHSGDISIAPVAPVVYHSDYHNPDGSRKPGVVAYIDGGQERLAEYNFDVTEDGLRSVSFDVTINEDSETEPPENIVITLSMSGSWGKRSTTQHYTLTVNDEGGTGMVGFSQAEIDKGPYGLFEIASLGQQNPGVVVELSSPAPTGGIDLVLKSSHPNEFFVGGIVHVQQHIRRCYVKLSQLSGDGNGGNYHFPEHRERCYFVDFNVKPDGDPEPDETYEIIISEDSPLPPKWGIDSNRSRREVTIYSSDNKVGIAGFIDPADGAIKKTVSVDESVSEGKVSLVLNVPNDPGPGYPGLPSGLHLRLNVNPLTADANSADIGNFISQDFTIPRRNQEGSFQHVIDIPITNDSDAEQLEIFSFRLNFQDRGNAHNSWGNVDSRNNTATLTIRQNDQKVGFTEDPLTITEGSTRETFIVSTSPLPSPMALRFVVREIHGTLDRFEEGDPASDEITIVSEQTFPMGSSRFRFPIEVSEDSIAEPDKLFLVQAIPIYKPAGYTLVPGGTRIVVPANDNHVGFAGGRSDFSEGAGSGVDGTVDITLTLTNPAPAGGLPLSISSVPGADSPVTFTIMPEDGLAYTHTIDIKDDKLIDKTRRYDLVLGKGEGFPNDWGAPGGRRTHHLWIYQDDFGEIGFSSAASEDPVAEGSTHNVEIELSKALAPGLHAFVDIRAVESDGDTKNDVSFDSAVRVDPGVFELSFPVEIEDDGLLEGEEEVVLHLSPRRSTAEGGFPENSVTITQGTYTFKIAGNDNVIQFEAPTSVLVEEDVGTISFKLKLTQPAPEGGLPVEIRLLEGNSTYATADDFILAEYGGLFTITPADGLEYTFSITIVDNDGPEGRESIRFELFPGDSFPGDWGAVADRPTVGGEEGSLYTIWIEAHNS